ncbi:VWA domain-containing protein [bacterium]|nr:VWA domain-containing protein [bacterium]
MQQIRLFILIAVLCIYAERCFAQGGGVDLYSISSAKLTKESTVDFKMKSSMQGLSRDIITVSAVGDTFNLIGGSSLIDLQWSLRYGFKRWMELSVSGVTYIDKNQDSYRYGSGDTRLGMKFGRGIKDSGMDVSGDMYFSFSTGFSEGSRLIRQFSPNKNSWGMNLCFDFNFRRFSVKVNGGYDNNGGKTDVLPGALSAFWFPLVGGYLGLNEDGKILRSNQYHFGFGSEVDLFKSLRFFGDYNSTRVLASNPGSVNLGRASMGLMYGSGEGKMMKLGYIMPFGNNQSDSGLMFEIRFNGLFSEKLKRRDLPVPVISEEAPAKVPGRKPFFSREGVFFSGARKPVLDTVFLLDISPSMSGRGLLADKGTNIMTDLPNFINAIIDTTTRGSNVALVTYGNEVSSLIWSSITNEKKVEIKRSINDIPDNAMEFVQIAEAGVTGTVEDIIGGLGKAYQILDSFKRSDYNRIHLQRIIMFTDDINDDANEDASINAKMMRLVRKYGISRNDFRYMYYLHTNQQTGKRVKEYVINFIEKEDGAIFREVNFAQKDDIIPRMDYNRTEQRAIFQYLSQVTSIAVISFKTGDNLAIGKRLSENFKTVFDYNEYFKIVDQVEVDRVVEGAGLSNKEKIEIHEAQKIGKRLGVDYVMIGEVIDFQMDREKGFYLPYFLGFPKTEMSIRVALSLIDVSDGSLVFVETIPASYSFRRGISLFPTSREDRTKHLSVIEQDILQNELLKEWAKKLRDRMFEDISVVMPEIQ